ncbi:hypothetical protein [Campylobacter concisus]|uniref:hypothetical protein n=1 Tax=Campylobacter concisus TaxID=199 RepID=UPI000D37D64C|nr:hypothetical protein [Campylobacter concisus]QPH88679.1 hypothetical protein CVT15_08205 [Campylobacter concisus]
MIVRNKEGLIKALWGYKDFTYGGHVEATLIRDTYTVKDYGKTILVIKKGRDILYFDNSFYSVTTSRFCNLLKEVFNFTAPERKAYLFDTEPKRVYVGGLGHITLNFTKEGLISLVSKKTERGYEFYKIDSLPPLVTLDIGGIYRIIETKLLTKED